MNSKKKTLLKAVTCVSLITMLAIFTVGVTFAADLTDIKKKGVLRHLGVPYANFVTGSGDGMDVELVRLFAKSLGVKYEYVKTSWKDVIGDLTGKKFKRKGSEVTITGSVPVKGDMIANGFTILAWRQKLVNFATPTFPSQVWIVARADSPVRPIKPSSDIAKDIAAVKALLKGHTVMGVANTCLAPSLYGIEDSGAKVKLFTGNLNELAPAVINRDAEATLLDVPDALIALQKWPRKIKVIGPVSSMQKMGCAFAQTSPKLRDAFNEFLEKCKEDGTYLRLVKKYYSAVFSYYPEFFK